MGEEKELPTVYAIDEETGESFKIGEIIDLPRLETGGIVEKDKCFIAEELKEGIEAEFSIKIKTIKKKRFIKLLMSKGYQRNEAIKMHEEYKQRGLLRSRIGLELFVDTYNALKECTIEVSFQGKDSE